MTKIITIFIIVVVCYCGYHLFRYWESMNDEEANKKRESAELALQGDRLEGMPYQLQNSLQVAQRQGGTAMLDWLKNYGPLVQDPRKAWIEMDVCVAIVRENPAEARRIFKTVKNRIDQNSPVWPRVKQLEKTFE